MVATIEGQILEVKMLRGEYDRVRIKFDGGKTIYLKGGLGHVFETNIYIVNTVQYDSNTKTIVKVSQRHYTDKKPH